MRGEGEGERLERAAIMRGAARRRGFSCGRASSVWVGVEEDGQAVVL